MMETIKIARYDVHLEKLPAVISAMQEFADYIQRETPETKWTTLQDSTHPGRFVTLIRSSSLESDRFHVSSEGTKRFVEALYPNVIGQVEFSDWTLAAESHPF